MSHIAPLLRAALLVAAALLPAACADTMAPPSGPVQVALGPATPPAPEGVHPYGGDLIQCVPYAKQVSGIDLMGDAWSWWDAAAGRYERGRTPRFMSVLVLRRTQHLKLGHVAVVVDLVGPREIRVTHANFGNDDTSRHVIYDSMPVADVSADNDWSLVRFWNYQLEAWGIVYPTSGFIYPERIDAANVPTS
jgi:CHAP domain